MIYGNTHHANQIRDLITKLLSDPDQSQYPFILIAGPSHIGKASVVHDIVASSGVNPFDIVTLQDLSDDRLQLKERNDLAGTFHPIQIEVESKRSDIRLDDGSMVHNWGIRELQEWLVRSPLGHTKVVIIEAIERASGGASNALLKTLEEPLPHRLIIATTHHLSQLPATIVSRAMVFHMDRLSDADMQQCLEQMLPGISPADRAIVVMLAAGRPGIVQYHLHRATLDDLVSQWKALQSALSEGVVAILYQQMSSLSKSGYLETVLDGLLYLAQTTGDIQLYDATVDVIYKQDSNINIENLLFEWCIKVIG